MRGDLVSGLSKKRTWRYLPSRIVSPSSPFLTRLSSLSGVSRFEHDYLIHFLNLVKKDNKTYFTLPPKFKLFLLKYNFLDKLNYSSDAFASPAIATIVPKFSDFVNAFSMNMESSFFSGEYNRSLYNLSSSSTTRHWEELFVNPYHLINWQSFLHKVDSSDWLGVRRYKLAPDQDVNLYSSQKLLKDFALNHVLLSQLPSQDLNSLGRFSLKVPIIYFL